MIARIILLSFVLGLSACSSPSASRIKDKSYIDQIVVGQTTQKDIIEEFGKPKLHGTRADNGEWWLYTYSDGPASHSLSVDFTPKGIVESFNYQPHAETSDEKGVGDPLPPVTQE